MTTTYDKHRPALPGDKHSPTAMDRAPQKALRPAHEHDWRTKRDRATGQPFALECPTCHDHRPLDAQ